MRIEDATAKGIYRAWLDTVAELREWNDQPGAARRQRDAGAGGLKMRLGRSTLADRSPASLRNAWAVLRNC